MILDKECMVADDLAYNGTADTLDTERVSPGPGQPIKMFVQGSGLSGATGLTITDSADGSTFAAHSTIVADFVSGLVEFELRSDVARYVKFALTGTVTAGTWNCGVVLPGNQTAA